MSLVPPSIIKTYAESLGVTTLSEEVIEALAQDVEYRTREIIQEAGKFMFHAHRQKLSVEDINHALAARNVERLYGYDPAESLNFRLVPNTNIFYVPREEFDLVGYVQQPLPKAPQPITLTSHWLAIEGVQPMIPENPPMLPESDATLSSAILGSKREAHGTLLQQQQEEAEVKPLAKHVLSKEVQAYFDAVIADLASPDTDRIKAALYSVATDSGLQQLLPYFIQFVAEQIPRNLRSLPQLQIYTGLISSLLANEHIFIEPYLHQLMPPLLSCLLGKRLCEDPQREDHWALRDRCATITADICRKFGHVYGNLVPRVAKTMIKTFLDTSKPITSQYGAIVGLTALGAHTIDALLIEHMETYLKALEASTGREMTDEEPIPSAEDVNRCRTALRNAAIKWLADCTEAPESRRSFVKDLFDIQ